MEQNQSYAQSSYKHSLLARVGSSLLGIVLFSDSTAHVYHATEELITAHIAKGGDNLLQAIGTGAIGIFMFHEGWKRREVES
jgi:hypothetical protein